MGKSCFNCRHGSHMYCYLFDELTISVGSCFMWDTNENRKQEGDVNVV